jgi:hypothetical protein
MLPIITICLMINYLDRSNVTNARVAGMQEDMNMTDVQWVSSTYRFDAQRLTCSVRRYQFVLCRIHGDATPRYIASLEVQA